MDSDPCTRKDCNQTTPHYIPNRSTVREVVAVISHQRRVFDGFDGTCVDRGSLKQVVEKEEKEHR